MIPNQPMYRPQMMPQMNSMMPSQMFNNKFNNNHKQNRNNNMKNEADTIVTSLNKLSVNDIEEAASIIFEIVEKDYPEYD
jgi:hypothetical protein